MKLDENVCLLLNKCFTRIIKVMKSSEDPREQGLSYPEMEYYWGKKKMALYTPHINLKDKAVLDAGCGLGGKTALYAENGCRSIVGIDMDENHINLAREFSQKKGISNAEFVAGDLSTLPFESNTFDIIFLNDVVEHIKKPIRLDALAECKRVIKANGKICLEFPPWTSPFAAHLDIIVPWCHLIFPPETLINVTRRMNIKPRAGKISIIEHFLELNHITIEEFKEIIGVLDFKVITYELIMLNNIKILRYVPLFNKLLTSRVVAVLSK